MNNKKHLCQVTVMSKHLRHKIHKNKYKNMSEGNTQKPKEYRKSFRKRAL